MGRTSKLNRADLPAIIAASKSVTEVLLKVGLDPTGGNYHTFKNYALKYKADYGHFDPWYHKVAYVTRGKKEALPLDEVLVETSSYGRSMLRKRLLRSELLPYNCAVCDNKGWWNDQKLVLVLDHINGVYNDHRLANLRWLCPNCNSQSSTFAGRNRAYKRK